MKTAERSELTKSERNVIESIHMGKRLKMGSLNRAQRLALLLSLTERGYLDENCKPTAKGIANSGPKFW